MVANHFHHASRTPCKLPLVKSSYVRCTVCIVDSDKSIIWIIHPSTHQEMASSDLPRSNRCWKLAKPINNLSKFSEIWKVWESTHLHRAHFNSYGLGVSVQKKSIPPKRNESCRVANTGSSATWKVLLSSALFLILLTFSSAGSYFFACELDS